MISFGPTEEQELIQQTVHEFAQSEMRERARPCDEKRELPDEFLQKSWELGLVAGAIPEAYGGGGIGRSPVTNALVLEELAWGDVPLAAAAMTPALFVQPLLDFGTDEQKQQFLPLFAGSSFHAASLALLEPTFSFDAASLRTVAEPKGSGFVALGQASGSCRWRRRESLPGRRARRARRRGGPRGVHRAARREGPHDRPGAREARSASSACRASASSSSGSRFRRRRGSAASAASTARGCSRCCAPRARRWRSASRAACTSSPCPTPRSAIAFGQPIAQKQAIAFMLAEMQIEVSSMRHLVWKAASLLEHGLDASRAATLALDLREPRSHEDRRQRPADLRRSRLHPRVPGRDVVPQRARPHRHRERRRRSELEGDTRP